MSTKGRSSRRSQKTELTPYQLEEIERAFVTFDSNKSGTIDNHEFRAALKAMGFDLKKEEVVRLMEQYAPQGNELSKEAFTKAMASLMAKRNPGDEIKKSFTLFDANQDRKIDFNDLSAAVHQAGLNIDPKTIQEMIMEFAQEGKNYISFDDFQEIMNPTQSY